MPKWNGDVAWAIPDVLAARQVGAAAVRGIAMICEITDAVWRGVNPSVANPSVQPLIGQVETIRYGAAMDLGTEDASGSRELYRSHCLVVREVASGDRDHWVITFDNYGIGHGFDRPGFGEAWLKAEGISAIHVMGKAEDWYQYSDIEAALASVRMAVGTASRVITYGSSMGGYGAVRFADAIGAHAALALSPQYTLDPDIVSHDRRWAQDAHRIGWIKRMNGRLNSAARIIVVYDPRGPDDWHGRRIAEESSGDAIRLPFTGHPVTSFLSEIGMLGSLVVDVLHDRLDSRNFEREARGRRATSGVYLGEIAGLQPMHRQATALALARRALDVSPANHHARLNLAKLLLRGDAVDEALLIFEGLVVDSEQALHYLVNYGQALAVAGRLTEARAIADQVIERASGIAHLNAWAAQLCWLNGDTAQAKKLIRHAVRLDPVSQGYLQLAADYHLGHPTVDITAPVKSTIWLEIARWIARRRIFQRLPGIWVRWLRANASPVV